MDGPRWFITGKMDNEPAVSRVVNGQDEGEDSKIGYGSRIMDGSARRLWQGVEGNWEAPSLSREEVHYFALKPSMIISKDGSGWQSLNSEDFALLGGLVGRQNCP